MIRTEFIHSKPMGSKKSFVKGLAAGAVLGAVAAMLSAMKDKNAKSTELHKTAMRIKDKVALHAKKLGKLSKTAYGKIVETTIAEYRGVKALSEGELEDLRDELKAGWEDVRKMMSNSGTNKNKR